MTRSIAVAGAFFWAIQASAAPTLSIIDPPGSIGAGVSAINSAGTIVGSYLDSQGFSHVYIRAADGTYTSFDAPAVGRKRWSFYGVMSINRSGRIAGTYSYGKEYVYHCFVRLENGAIGSFDAPGAGTALGQGSFCTAINRAGAIMGRSVDSNGVSHGFVRKAGITTIFDPPQSTATYPTGMNSAGAITGIYGDGGDHGHGFMRDADGAITPFDVPVDGAVSTRGDAINDAGVISGSFTGTVVGANYGSRGFLRNADGTFVTFGVTNSRLTDVSGISARGEIVGTYFEPYRHGRTTDYRSRGYVRTAQGTIYTFGIRLSDQFVVAAINDRNFVVGSYQDSPSEKEHAFLRSP